MKNTYRDYRWTQLVQQDVRRRWAFDATFEEGKHPRGQPSNAGQFGPGGEGGAGKTEAKKTIYEGPAVTSTKGRLSRQEIDAVNVYASEEGLDINEALWRGGPAKLPKHLRDSVKLLDSILDRSVSSENVKVYRAVSKLPGFLSRKALVFSFAVIPQQR